MRQRGERFLTNRVLLPRNVIEPVLLQIKQARGWSWGKFAEYLGVSELTLRVSLRLARTTIPIAIFKKLQSLCVTDTLAQKYAVLPAHWGQSIGGMCCTRRRNSSAILPGRDTVEFAEFYGAMLGDGCIYSTLQSIGITCNAIQDRWYVVNHLSQLCQRLFNATPRIYFRQSDNAVQLTLNSKKVTEFLLQQGFPAGKKNASLLVIPEYFFASNHILAACVRGFVDTDGGVHPHPNSKIMLSATTKSVTLLSSLQRAFKQLEVPIGITRYSLQMYGREKVARFFSQVGSSNPRNIVRYRQFLQEGKAPTAKETESLLKDRKQEFSVPYLGPMV